MYLKIYSFALSPYFIVKLSLSVSIYLYRSLSLRIIADTIITLPHHHTTHHQLFKNLRVDLYLINCDTSLESSLQANLIPALKTLDWLGSHFTSLVGYNVKKYLFICRLVRQSVSRNCSANQTWSASHTLFIS